MAADRLGLEQALILEKAGVDLSKVVIGHVGDTNDLDYLEELLRMGVYLGLDRFGQEVLWPEEDRVRNLLELMDRGWIKAHHLAGHPLLFRLGEKQLQKVRSDPFF